MPRKKATANVAAGAPAEAHQIVRQVADSFVLPGDAAEPVSVPPAATNLAPGEPPRGKSAGPRPNTVWARIDGPPDGPVGIKVETETERHRGIAHPRVLVRFRDDLLPTSEEKARLKADGFKYCPDVRAWGRMRSAAALVLAKRVAAELARGRGDEGVGLYV